MVQISEAVGQLVSEKHLKSAPKMGSADHGGTWSPLLSDPPPPCWQFNEEQQGLEQGLTASPQPLIRIQAAKHNMLCKRLLLQLSRP